MSQKGTSFPMPRTSRFSKMSTISVKSDISTGTVRKREESVMTSILANAKGTPSIEGSLKVQCIIPSSYKLLSSDCHIEKHLHAVGTAEGAIEIRGTKTNRTLRQFFDESGLPITSLSFVHNPATTFLLGSCASGRTTLWNCKSGNIEWSVKEQRQTLVNAIKTDNTAFVAGGTDCKITMYDMETRQLIHMFESSLDPNVMDGHKMRIFDVKFNPSSEREFVSGGWDNTIQFWDTRAPNSVRSLYGPHICGDGIEFLEWGTQLLTASWTREESLQVWDYNQGTLLETIEPDEYSSFLYSCRYVEKGNFFVTGGVKDNLFRAVDMEGKTSVAVLKDLPHGVCFVEILPPHSTTDVFTHVAVGAGSDIYVLEVLV